MRGFLTMNFPKENSLDNFIKNYNKKHQIKSFFINLKIRLHLFLISLRNDKNRY